MQPIDITMTAARRPELVWRTLSSFWENILKTTPIGTFFVNIDPIWGDEAQANDVEAICRGFHANTVVRHPSDPSYGGAVKWLWSSVRSSWNLHLEDDWLLNMPISPKRLAKELERDCGQLLLFNGEPWRRRKSYFKIGVSPSFVRREYAHTAARYMDANLDPEKQFYKGHNPEGLAALSQFKIAYFGGLFTPTLLTDVGRNWRDARGITKSHVGGASVWSTLDKVKAAIAVSMTAGF